MTLYKFSNYSEQLSSITTWALGWILSDIIPGTIPILFPEQFRTCFSLITFDLNQPNWSLLASAFHQRFERYIDMIEISLRSMVNHVVWPPHTWALCLSTIIIAEPLKCHVTIPFVSRYQIRPRSDHRYLHTLFQPCYRRTLFTRSM